MNVRRAGDVAWRRIGRETVVIHLTRRRMFGLNETGGRLWEALAEPVGLEELTGAADPDPAVTAFLADLAAEGLVEIDGPLLGGSAEPPATDVPPPPRIEWREEVQRFAGHCAFFPGGSVLCDQHPFNS